jgi:hypothetical protein
VSIQLVLAPFNSSALNRLEKEATLNNKALRKRGDKYCIMTISPLFSFLLGGENTVFAPK